MAKTELQSADNRLYPCTWDEVKDAELDDSLRATPAQRLAWLEEVMKFAFAARAARISSGGR